MNQLRNVLLGFCVILSTSSSFGQDTTDIKYQLKYLSDRIDSLESILDGNSLTNYINKDSARSRDDKNINPDLLESLTSFLSFDEEIQSSKRKRINDLLGALRSAPGILNFKGSATSSIQWKSGPDHFSTAVASFDIFAFSQLGDNVRFFANIEAIGGNGPNSQLNTFSGLNGDAGSTQNNTGLDLLHILEAWAELDFLNGWFNIIIGKLDLTNYFDINAVANDETLQFLSDPFVNSTAFPVPQNSAGIKVNAKLANLLFFQFACASEDNSGNDIFNQLFKILSTGLHTNLGEGFYGEYHIYVYKSGIEKDAAGFGVSASHSFNGLRIFGRWNNNNLDYSNIFPYKNYWSAGFDLNSSAVINDTKIGAAFGKINPFNKSLKDEMISEFYIRYQFNEWIYVSPHLQLVKNSAGIESDYLLFGLRSHFTF